MSIHDAMREACAAVGIAMPRRVEAGRWSKSPVIGKTASNTSGRVMIFDDQTGGIAYNWATGQQQKFTIRAQGEASTPRPRDMEKERRQEAERAEIERICGVIVKGCSPAQHPYLARKGFPDELGLVCADPRDFLPNNSTGEMVAHAIPKCDGPMLIVPGRIGDRLTTVQFITPEGEKVNIVRGLMSGACHRIATGRETWVCEGIATALSVRAALRLLGRSATVVSAFSANNVGKVASGLSGCIVAADHDKPVDTLGGLGTGEFYARKSARSWVMPPQRGDFNDMHMSDGLRAVALRLREVCMG